MSIISKYILFSHCHKDRVLYVHLSVINGNYYIFSRNMKELLNTTE